MKKIGVTRFLGTNCDRDVWRAVEQLGFKPQWLWHEDRFARNAVDAVVVPGGFSYGDYLRAGALAAKSPVMDSLREFAQAGGPVLGICNGFQILCEAKLLPGVLVRNQGQRFIDQWQELTLVNSNRFWAAGYHKNQAIRLPIAHGEGRFFVKPEELKTIEDRGQVWWRYQGNPNGALADIAGVANQQGNVAALMPHPERALHGWMGGSDGVEFFASLLRGM